MVTKSRKKFISHLHNGLELVSPVCYLHLSHSEVEFCPPNSKIEEVRARDKEHILTRQVNILCRTVWKKRIVVGTAQPLFSSKALCSRGQGSFLIHMCDLPP